jgi:hypothetical protein
MTPSSLYSIYRLAEKFLGGLPPPLNFVRVFVRVSYSLVRRNFVNSYESSYNAVVMGRTNKLFKLSRYVKRQINICTPMHTAHIFKLWT